MLKLKRDLGLESSDKIILISSVVGMFFFSFCLWNEELIVNKFVPMQRGQVQIGSVQAADNDVRRKFNKSLTWYKAKKNETVFEGDSIFTGQNSDSIIKLASGLDLTISENSLVVLTQKKDEVVLDLKLGNILANTSGVKKKISLKQGDQKTVVKLGQKGNLNLSKNQDGHLSISGQGGIQLNINGKEQTIDSNTRIKIDKNQKIQKEIFDITLLYPKNRSKVWLAKNEDLFFEWKGKKTDTLEYKWIVAEDSLFKKIVKESHLNQRSHHFNDLEDKKKYYWKVEAIKNGVVVSLSDVSQFQYLKKYSVQLFMPMEKQSFYSKNESKEIIFKWSSHKKFNSYKIEIYNDKDLKNKVFEKNGIQNLVISEIPIGKYFWRVKPIYKKVKLPWSRVGTFHVEMVDAEKTEIEVADLVVEDLTPEIEKIVEVEQPPEKLPPLVAFSGKHLEGEYILEFDYKKLKRSLASQRKAIINPPQFLWKVDSQKNSFILQVSKTSKFKKLVFEKELKTNNWTWKGVNPGQYYWRVVEKNSNQLVKGFKSGAKKIHILLPDPSLRKEYKYKRVVKTVKGLNQKSEVSWGWKSTPMAKRYMAQLSDDEEFKKSKKINIKTPSFKWSFKKDGEYYFKVASVNNKGKRTSKYSNVAKIKFKKILDLKRPKLSFPDNGMSVVSFGENEYEPILFSWTENKQAEQYVIQFARDAKFKDIAIETTAKENNFLLSKKPKSSKLYWRVRSKYKKFRSKWSKYRKFSFKSQ